MTPFESSLVAAMQAEVQETAMSVDTNRGSDELEARMDVKLGHLENELRDEIRRESTGLREEIRNESTELRRQMDGLMMQIRALQVGSAIAAFALSVIVMLSRMIK